MQLVLPECPTLSVLPAAPPTGSPSHARLTLVKSLTNEYKQGSTRVTSLATVCPVHTISYARRTGQDHSWIESKKALALHSCAGDCENWKQRRSW